MLDRCIAPVSLALLAALSACAGKPPVIAVAPPVPVIPAEAPPAALPPGASPGMAVPAMLADGTFPTPNRALTPAATLWHVRVGLNVAALACRENEAAVVARYNTFLGAHRAALAKAEATYAAEFRATGGEWRDRYDDAMTRLYNFYATPPAQRAFCAAAAQVLADASAVPGEGLATFAGTALPSLDRPFTDFYRAYDAWRRASVPVVVAAAPAPRLRLDRASLFDDRLTAR